MRRSKLNIQQNATLAVINWVEVLLKATIVRIRRPRVRLPASLHGLSSHKISHRPPQSRKLLDRGISPATSARYKSIFLRLVG